LFQRVVFRSNTAGQLGGAVLLQTGSSTTFDGCEFSDNQSGLTDGHNGAGGGIYVAGSSPTFVGCTISGNRAVFAGGGVGTLTGFDQPRTLITMRDCLVEGNVVSQAGPQYPPVQGGGIHHEGNSVMVLERTVVRDNQANQGGGLS